MFKNSVSKFYHRQFNIPDNVVGFSYGNLTHLKSQECLGMVKSEIQTQNSFSNTVEIGLFCHQIFLSYRVILSFL